MINKYGHYVREYTVDDPMPTPISKSARRRKTKQYIEELEVQIRNLKAKVNRIRKSSENNYNGMLYWKQQANYLRGGVNIINEWTGKAIEKTDAS